MKYLAALVVLFFFGCQDVERPKEPKDLIPKEQMVDILVESYLINAARSFDIRTIKEKGVKLDSFIYKKYKIDSIRFALSNAYYTADLNTYNDLLTSVDVKLDFLKERADSIKLAFIFQEEERLRQDSINALEGDSTSVDTESGVNFSKRLDSIKKALAQDSLQ